MEATDVMKVKIDEYYLNETFNTYLIQVPVIKAK